MPKLTILFPFSLSHNRLNKMDDPNVWSVVLMTSYVPFSLRPRFPTPSELNHFKPPISPQYPSHKAPQFFHTCVCSFWVPPFLRLSLHFRVHVLSKNISYSIHKLQTCSIKCVFLGYPYHFHGYRFYDPSTGKVHLSSHDTFDKTLFPFANSSPPPSYVGLFNILCQILFCM